MKENTGNEPLSNADFKEYIKEFSEDLKANTKALLDVVEANNILTDKAGKIMEQIQTQKPTLSNENDKAALKVIRQDIADLKLVVQSLPKNITRKLQILLFPEQDRKLFYKIVFGRWIWLLALMLLLNNGYKFGVHWSDNKREVAIRQIENDRVQKAWNRLYYHSNQSTKRLMDEAYRGSLKQKQ